MLLHGIGSHWQAWEPVLDALAAEHEVWALDLPGFGASPPLPAGERHDVPGLTAAVRAFCAAHAIERPHVCGWSTGGGIALELAAAGDVASVCAIAPIGFWSARERAYSQVSLKISLAVAGALRPVVPALVGNPVGRTMLFGQVYAKPWRVDPADCVATLDALLGATAFDETLASFDGYLAPADAADDVPVTIVWGARDRLLLPRQARRAQRRLPKARHVLIAGAGHAAVADDPAATAQVVLAAAAAPTR